MAKILCVFYLDPVDGYPKSYARDRIPTITRHDNRLTAPTPRPYNGMTPHMSGTSLSGQARYAAGTREILECSLEGRPMREEYLIVDGGKLAGTGARSYTVSGGSS